MNIIICGAGRVGFTIAKLLSEQNHSITVIDQSSDDIQKINETLDVKAIVGKATSPAILEKANIAEANMIIAVTRNDEINMLICQIAYSLFKIPKKIARIRAQEYLDPKFSQLFNKENLPIDFVISPEIEIAKSIHRKLESPGSSDNVPFANNNIRLLEILVDERCPINNIKLNELTKKFPKLNANILGVVRDDKFIFLKKNDVLKKNDKAYVAINALQIQETLEAFGHNDPISKKILLIGGGNIGYNLAKYIEASPNNTRLKIIEKNKERAKILNSNLKRLNFSNSINIMDALDSDEKEKYDVILIDAPCSSVGTIRKNPEIFFRKNREDINKYIQIQKKLLKKSVKLSNKNTLIIYMVCSFLEEETTRQIDDFLKLNKNFDIEKFKTSIYKKLIDKYGYINSFPTIINNQVKIDGFFAAKIKRDD